MPEEEDPNDWLSQICGNLQRTPEERLEGWTRFSNEALLHKAQPDRGPRMLTSLPVGCCGLCLTRTWLSCLWGWARGYVQGAPYPSTNTDFTPRRDPVNLRKVEQVLRGLAARPLKHDLWHPVADPNVAGFRRVLTSAGMVKRSRCPAGSRRLPPAHGARRSPRPRRGPFRVGG